MSSPRGTMSQDIDREYYATLGLSLGVSIEETKKAYRKAALLSHPDKNPNDPEAGAKFRKIQEAYEALGKKHKDGVSESHLVSDDPRIDKFHAAFSETYSKSLTQILNIIPTLRESDKDEAYNYIGLKILAPTGMLINRDLIDVCGNLGFFTRDADQTNTMNSIFYLYNPSEETIFNYKFPSMDFPQAKYLYDHKILISMRDFKNKNKIQVIFDMKTKEARSIKSEFAHLFGRYCTSILDVKSDVLEAKTRSSSIMDISTDPPCSLGQLPVKDEKEYVGKFLAVDPTHKQIAVLAKKKSKDDSAQSLAEIGFWNIDEKAKKFNYLGEIKTTPTVQEDFYCGDYFILMNRLNPTSYSIECWSLKMFLRIASHNISSGTRHTNFQALPSGLGFISLCKKDYQYLCHWDLNTLTPHLIRAHPKVTIKIDSIVVNDSFLAYKCDDHYQSFDKMNNCWYSFDKYVFIISLKETMRALQPEQRLLQCSSSLWKPAEAKKSDCVSASVIEQRPEF